VRILHTEASCGWGGQEIRILEESRGLIARGHDVAIACAPQARMFEEARLRGIAVHALPIARKRLPGLLALRRWLAAHPVDVINTHSSTDSWLAALACSGTRQAPPLVRTRHISAAVPDNFATRWLYTKATRHIVTTGEKLRRQLIEVNGYPAAAITSVPTGIDPARFCPGDKATARRELGLDPAMNYIGIVATLRSWKGHLYLLDAFAALQRDDWRLLIVGDGPMRNVIEPRIAELGLGDRVTLTGQQAAPERWLRALDVFCLPSYANEGVPQAVVQAMMTGLPVLSTPVGSIAEAVEDGASGLLVAPRDSGALTQALRRLADDAALGARLGAAAGVRARQYFSAPAMLDAMERIFLAVARGQRP